MFVRRIARYAAQRYKSHQHIKQITAAYRISTRTLQQRNDVQQTHETNTTTSTSSVISTNNDASTQLRSAFHLTDQLGSIIASWRSRSDAPRLLPAQAISGDATLLEALNTFVALPFSSLPLLVIDDNGLLIGMITQRDIIDQIVDLKAANQQWSSRSVHTIMTKARDMACLNAADTLESCLTLMVTGQLHYLPFIERDTVIGFLSLPAIVASAFLSNTQPQSLKPAATHMMKEVNESSKATYLRALKPHLGIPRNTKVQQPRSSMITKKKSSSSSHNALKPYLRIAQYQLPHPDKLDTGGEDFIVVSCEPVTSWSALAVFDGVGSWSFEQGVDVRLFSKAFADATHDIVDEARRTSSQAVSPAQLLSRAWERVQKAQVVGSCTACVVTIEPKKDNEYATLRSISVGDSGFIILRPRSSETQSDAQLKAASYDQSHDELQSSESGGEFFPISIFVDVDDPHKNSRFTVHHRSTQQLHYFNCPYQLGLTKTGETSFDRIEDGTDSAAQLMHGDIILLSTDGLWDNLHESTIVEIVESHITNVDALNDGSTTPIVDVAAAAKALGDRALRQSWDRSVDSPFALLAKDHNIQWGGGRRDDISVVVLQYVGNGHTTTT